MDRIVLDSKREALDYVEAAKQRGCGAVIVPFPGGKFQVCTWDRRSK